MAAPPAARAALGASTPRQCRNQFVQRHMIIQRPCLRMGFTALLAHPNWLCHQAVATLHDVALYEIFAGRKRGGGMRRTVASWSL